jgi:transcription elongation factor Elf1
MIIAFECKCGNKDTNKVVEYDRSLGYEALICKVCGTYYDFDNDGKPRVNPPDEFSLQFVTKSKEVKA